MAYQLKDGLSLCAIAFMCSLVNVCVDFILSFCSIVLTFIRLADY